MVLAENNGILYLWQRWVIADLTVELLSACTCKMLVPVLVPLSTMKRHSSPSVWSSVCSCIIKYHDIVSHHHIHERLIDVLEISLA